MGLDRARVDQHLLDAKVGEFRLIDIRLVVQRHADLVDDLVAPLLLDVGADQPRLVAMDIMLAQDLLDRLDAGLDGRLVAGGAILAQQIFQHVGGHDGVALDRLDEVLADHQAREVAVDFPVQLVHRSPARQKSKSLVNERRIK